MKINIYLPECLLFIQLSHHPVLEQVQFALKTNLTIVVKSYSHFYVTSLFFFNGQGHWISKPYICLKYPLIGKVSAWRTRNLKLLNIGSKYFVCSLRWFFFFIPIVMGKNIMSILFYFLDSNRKRFIKYVNSTSFSHDSQLKICC